MLDLLLSRGERVIGVHLLVVRRAGGDDGERGV